MSDTRTLEETRRAMLSYHEAQIETAARELHQATGRAIDDCRDWARAMVMAALPPATRVFLECGKLPELPD